MATDHPELLLEVRCYVNDRLHGTGECAEPEEALTAARTLWDDATADRRVYGRGSRVRVTFLADGELVRTVERYRP